MNRRTTSFSLLAIGVVAGGLWVAVDELRQPTPDELAQRACIAEVQRSAHEADDSGALAAEAADCSNIDL
jgi:hypothetical protein